MFFKFDCRLANERIRRRSKDQALSLCLDTV
jgi:hypothetical protein